MLLQRATDLGCREAWTATEPGNLRAQALYSRAGGVADPTPFVMFTFALAKQDAPPSQDRGSVPLAQRAVAGETGSLG